MQDKQDTAAEQSIVELINNTRKTILDLVNGDYFTERLKAYLAPIREKGPPYVDYEGEPRQVRQIKDIVNALYHAEFVVSKINLSWDSASNVHLIYDSAVKAAHHLTYLDLDIVEVFGGEIQLLIQELSKVSSFLNQHGQDIDELADLASKSVSSYKIGKIAGMAINQLNPNQGRPDYPFLTQFSASLPGYIQKLTHSISQYSQTVATIQPHLNQEQIDELKQGAITLLESINVIQNSSATFLPFHLMHYIAILKQVATVATATFDEIGLMNNASQELVANNICKLKLDLLPKLLAEVDKVEDQFLLRPGTLSNPLLQQLTELYSQLIDYAAIVVDFSTRDGFLRHLDDEAFKRKRIQLTKNRILESQSKLHNAKMASQSFDDFFREIFSENNANTPLVELSTNTKKRLIHAYQPLEAYVKKISPELHNQIVNGLTQGSENKVEKAKVEMKQAEESAGFSLFSPFKQAYNWWYSSEKQEQGVQQDTNCQVKNDVAEGYQGWGFWTATKGTVNYYYNKTLGNLINWDELRQNLKPIIDRELATHRFHTELNEDVIRSINAQHANLLFIYEEEDAFLVDEKAVLTKDGLTANSYTFAEENGFCFIADAKGLSSGEAFHLALVYEDKQKNLLAAREAYVEFITRMKAMLATPDEKVDKSALKQAYLCFRPWVMPLVKDAFDEQNIVDFLNLAEDAPPFEPIIGGLINIDQLVLEKFDKAEAFYNQQKSYYFLLGEKILHSTPLALSKQDVSRSNFLIKHTKYSQSVSILRKHLDGLMDIFSVAVQQELKMDSFDELPFPELEDKNSRLAQSQQLIGIKSLFKMLYHLEQSIKQFEKLNTTSYQATFLAHLAGVQNHALQLYNLAEILYQDPHANKIYSEFLEQILSMKTVLLDSTAPYLEKPDETIYKPDSNPLWLATQAFLLIPEQIKAAKTGRPLLETEKAAVQQSAIRIVSNVERIIANAGSYFKLFLEVPTFYRLFKELRIKLGEFASLSHGFAINHLSDINDILNNLLIEADKIELNFGLKPGFISSVLQDVFDQFMKGLLDPLNLSSKQYLDLLTTSQPLLNRKRETSAFHQSLGTEKEELMSTIKNLEQFLVLIDKEVTQQGEDELKRIFLIVYPLLAELGNSEPPKLPLDDFDKLIQSNLDIAKPLNQIIERVRTALAYQKGCLATKSFTCRAIEEQRNYLDQLFEEKQKRNEALTLNYTKQTLENYVAQMPDTLLHYSAEYKNEFINYLGFYKDNLIKQAKDVLDIQQKIEQEVQLRLNHFNQSEWSGYKQLDDFITALNTFDHYLTKAGEELDEGSTLFFETKDTIRAKLVTIHELRHLANDKALPVEVRISSLKEELSRQDSVLLDYKHYERGSFKWLIQCIVDLLEALHLYTPKYKQHYQQALEKVSAPGTASNYQTGFSFFEQGKDVRPNEISEDESQELNSDDNLVIM